MRDIIFYDFDFNRLGDFSRAISLNMEKKYCGYGSCELHFSIDEQQIIKLLENNEYLFFITDKGIGIVTGWQIGDDIAIYGRTPEWLLTKRGVEAFSVADATAETIARTAIESVSDFVIAGESLNVGEKTSYSTEDVRSLYDVVCEVLKTQSLGFEVFPDIAAKQFVFRVYEGKESLCMFSQSNRTAYDMKYSVEKQDAVTNSGWYKRRYADMGGWDAALNIPSLSDNEPANAYTFYKITSESYDSDGDRIKRFDLWCRKDTYLYCDNSNGAWKISETKPDTIWVYIDGSQKTGLQKWDAVLSGIKTDEEAKSEILQMAKRSNTDCETYRLEYKADYNLGDIVYVQLEFGDFKRTEKKRVVSVDVYCDIDRSGTKPILESLEE